MQGIVLGTGDPAKKRETDHSPCPCGTHILVEETDLGGA